MNKVVKTSIQQRKIWARLAMHGCGINECKRGVKSIDGLIRAQPDYEPKSDL